MVCMYHSFLIHSSADGHLGCFHVLAIINSAHFWAYTSRKPDQKETRAQSCQGVRDLRDLRGSPLLHLCDICWDIMSTTSEVSAQTAHKAEGQTGMVTLGSRVWGFSLLWLMSDCLFFHVVSEVFLTWSLWQGGHSCGCTAPRNFCLELCLHPTGYRKSGAQTRCKGERTHQA